jgi:TRAP-type C4-dicarboxylate transport system substrate-binding protein
MSTEASNKKLARRSFIKAGAATAAIVGFPSILRAQAPIELKISHYVPALHGLQTDFIEPWSKEIEKRTNGRVTFKIFAAASPLGKAENQLDQAQSGVVDIAFGLSGNPRGRMPRSLIVEMPFLIESAGQGSNTLMSVYQKYLKDEYKGLKVLSLLTHNAGHIHTRDKKVEKMEDLVGLRLRTPSATASAMLTQLGAVPVGMPPGAAYEQIDKGVIDGACFPWDPVRAFRIDEVTKFHTVASFYTAAFWFGMNEKKYNALPADVKKIIDELSGEYLTSRMQGWWDKWDAAGRAAAVARKNTIITLSPTERKRWADALIPTYNKVMIETEGQGVKNARDIYIEMQRAAAKFAPAKKA